jgi:hypothetical protein
MISTIAGILAIVVAFIPIVGTALAGVLIVIAAVAAIVSAVANITLAATGERSWAEAGIAIAGAALSLIGLGGAAKAATGLAKGISKGAFKQGMQKGWCKLGFGACFVAGTPVLTADGTKPIEDIVVGDKVWTRNLVTGLDELQLVAETFVHQTLALYHLTINGAIVSTTAEHPFMVQDRGWQMAGNLRPGDLLVTPDGTTVLEAVGVEERDLADIVEVYNFHVENNLNYYVHAGNTPVLVHNNHRDDATEIVSKKADKWFDTQDDARNAVLDAYGVSDKSLVDTHVMYGSNPNIKGPQGQPWEQLEAFDDSGRLVKIDHHANGHYFKDTNEYALPHYHGPEGHYFYGNERIW